MYMKGQGILQTLLASTKFRCTTSNIIQISKFIKLTFLNISDKSIKTYWTMLSSIQYLKFQSIQNCYWLECFDEIDFCEATLFNAKITYTIILLLI
jgi:hypothetical protein